MLYACTRVVMGLRQQVARQPARTRVVTSRVDAKSDLAVRRSHRTDGCMVRRPGRPRSAVRLLEAGDSTTSRTAGARTRPPRGPSAASRTTSYRGGARQRQADIPSGRPNRPGSAPPASRSADLALLPHLRPVPPDPEGMRARVARVVRGVARRRTGRRQVQRAIARGPDRHVPARSGLSADRRDLKGIDAARRSTWVLRSRKRDESAGRLHLATFQACTHGRGGIVSAVSPPVLGFAAW